MANVKGRVISVSQDKCFYKIGNDIQTSVWYGKGTVDVTPLVKGAEVEIEFAIDPTGKRVLSKIGAASTPAPAAPVLTGALTPPVQKYGDFVKSGATAGTGTKTWGKSADEQEAIKAQAVGHMVSRSLMVFNGQLDVNNFEVVGNLMEKLYEKYYSLVQAKIDAKKTS